MEGNKTKIDPIWKRKDVVGIDIGSRSIKFVQIKKNGSGSQVVGYGQMPVPDNYIIEGSIVESEKLAEEIKKYLDTSVVGQITAKRAYASLPESKIFTRTISIPRGNEKGLEEAVNWDASQTVPMAMTDLYLDYQIIGPSHEDPELDEVLYAAAPKAIVNSYVQLFGLLGIELAGIETSLTAIIRAMNPKAKVKEAALIVDIGGQTTNLAVYDNAIRVTGSTLVGGDQITNHITEVMGISNAGAEALKKKPAKEIEKVSSAFEATAEEIFREASVIIKYYEEKSKEQIRVSKVCVCGGSASLPSLAKVFTDRLGLNTEIVSSVEGVSYSKKAVMPSEDAPAYVNAIGLALLGVRDD